MQIMVFGVLNNESVSSLKTEMAVIRRSVPSLVNVVAENIGTIAGNLARDVRNSFFKSLSNIITSEGRLSYLMGHPEINVTLNVYTHIGYGRASMQMLKLMDGVQE